MKDATLQKVAAEVANWPYWAELPPELSGFSLQKELVAAEDKYNILSYINEEKNCRLTAYFHEETMEYKVRECRGLTEFCHIDIMSDKLDTFYELLQKNLAMLLNQMADLAPKANDILLSEKHIDTWEYGQNLPTELDGFRLFISPANPLKINNGSYVIVNYADFAIASDFSIIYNVFRDEFFGEARVNNIPDVNYAFDSQSLDELTDKLSAHLAPRLAEIRRLAMPTAKA